MNKKHTFTDRLLLFIATLNDFQRNSLSVNRMLGWYSGNPYYHKSKISAYKYIENKKDRKKLLDAFHYLKRRGYIYVKSLEMEKEKCYAFSPKGELKIFHLQASGLKKKKSLPRGEWFMVFFDIPETMRRKRDLLRKELGALGFQRLQKSIWITSFDIRKEFKKLREILDIKKYCKFLIVKEIDDNLEIDKWIY